MRRDIVLAAGIVGLALLVRVICLAEFAQGPFFRVSGLDGLDYHEEARQVARGRWPAPEPFFRPPLYPLVLGGIYRISGEGPLGPKVFQAFLGAATCGLTYAMGLVAFGARRIAVTAGLIGALSGTLVWYDLQLLSTSLDVFLQTAALLVLLVAGRRPRRLLLWAAAGGLVGLAGINRSEALFIAPVALLFMGWTIRRGALRPGAAFLAALAAVLLPVALHNARHDPAPAERHIEARYDDSLAATLKRLVTGQFVTVASSGGVNFHLGNHSASRALNDTNHPEHFEHYSAVVREPLVAGIEGAAARSRYLVRVTLADIAAHPGPWLREEAMKALRLVNGAEVSRNANIYAHREHSLVLRTLLFKHGRWGLAFPGGLVIPLALCGLFLARGRGTPHVLLTWRLVALAVFLLAFFVTARYRAPAVPILAVYAAVAVDWLVARWRARDHARLAALGLVLAGLLVLCHLPLVAIHRSHGEHEYLDLARTLGLENDLDGALGAFEKALAVNGASFSARSGIGNLLRLKGRPDAAIEHLTAALEMARSPSDQAAARNNLALVYLDLGRAADAETELREAIRLDPNLPTAHSNLGSLLVRRGETEAGLAHYRQALRLDPDHADAHYNVGAVLEFQGDLSGAAASYERAISAPGGHERARRKLEALQTRESSSSPPSGTSPR